MHLFTKSHWLPAKKVKTKVKSYVPCNLFSRLYLNKTYSMTSTKNCPVKISYDENLKYFLLIKDRRKCSNPLINTYDCIETWEIKQSEIPGRYVVVEERKSKSISCFVFYSSESNLTEGFAQLPFELCHDKFKHFSMRNSTRLKQFSRRQVNRDEIFDWPEFAKNFNSQASSSPTHFASPSKTFYEIFTIYFLLII